MKSKLKVVMRLAAFPASVLLFAGWLLFGGQSAAAQGESSRPGRSPAPLREAVARRDLTSRLEEIIPRLMKEGDVPGLSVALVRGGEILWHRGFGVRSAETKEPVRDDTTFEAASLSKPVFAYAVLKLVDAGKLDLDTPLAAYLPEPYLQNDARVKLITARMVLDHTTGFQNEATPGKPLKIYFSPGEKFSYSGEGYLYLQRVVERVTGEPLEAFMRRTVFEPLGMTSSCYVCPGDYDARAASGHDPSGAVAVGRRPAAARAYSGLHTTALDYARFMLAVVSGAGLKKETAGQMLKRQVRLDESCFSCIERSPGRLSHTLSWGLGWALERTGGRGGRLALGRQQPRVSELRHRVPEREVRRRHPHQQRQRAFHHPGDRLANHGRRSPGFRLDGLRALQLPRQTFIQGHPRARRRRDK
jgi:CubicO group peptidase (beta-lactamase class C family)